MQEEVQRRLSGPDPTRGYYCDDRSGRYFPIPKPGTMGYPMYHELKERIEKEVTAELAAQKASQKKRRIGSIYSAVWELRSGYALSRPSEVKFLLERITLGHEESANCELLLGPSKSRLMSSSTRPEQLIAVGSNFIYDFSITEMAQENMAAHSCGDVSDLRSHPDLPFFSTSSLSGSIQVRSYDDLSLQEAATNFQTSIWTHQWMSSKDVFCGCDSQGTLHDVRSGRWTKVYSGKSTIFTVAPVRGSEQEILFGTRAGKLFRFDRRKRQSFCLEAPKQAKRDPFCHLEAMKDANYVIGSHTDGLIEMLDLRMLAPVMSWSTGSSKLENNARFSLSYDQSFLAVAGKDCVVRIFDITLPTDEPIFEVPQTDPVADIIWSEEWTSRRLRGFGVGAGTELRFLPIPFS